MTLCLILAVFFCEGVAASQPARPDELTQDYYSVLTTYACHARSLWHDAGSGGYWGDGLDAKDQNGAVRGTVNTLYAYAVLVGGMDDDLICHRDRKMLRRAGLSRERMLDYIRKDIEYLVAHHKSATMPMSPQWGYHWQSPLWMGALGPASLLVWDELGPDLRDGLKRTAAAEADWVASRAPKNGRRGDTGAEENAWNTNAPAVALAMSPEATSATLWWRALQKYSANVYSRPSDFDRAKTAESGPAADVMTTNIFDDFSLLNHGFFHPDYVQVSAQHLGESWMILSLGDTEHHTRLADDFEPWARFNVYDMWKRIMRPLLLPTGEFAFPAGNDWTYHCSTNQAYFAYIATAFGDTNAASAEVRALKHVLLRREASPPGRLLGDSNLEWWWEPLVAKRCCAALLLHRVSAAKKAGADVAPEDQPTTTVMLNQAHVWWRRTPSYFVSVSWKKPELGYFTPTGPEMETHPYLTLPRHFGILPRGKNVTLTEAPNMPEGVAGAVLKDGEKAFAAVVCLPRSVVWISARGFQPIAIENDTLTMPGRSVEFSDAEKPVLFKALTPRKVAAISAHWMCVDGAFAMATDGSGFTYEPAGRWNMKSVAADEVKPVDAAAWQMAGGDAGIATKLANNLKSHHGTRSVSVSTTDADSDRVYNIVLSDDGLSIK